MKGKNKKFKKMWPSISCSDRLTQLLMLARNIVEVVFMLFWKTTSGKMHTKRFRFHHKLISNMWSDSTSYKSLLSSILLQLGTSPYTSLQKSKSRTSNVNPTLNLFIWTSINTFILFLLFINEFSWTGTEVC